MATDSYVSPYANIDERLRSSVLGAQANNRSIHDIHQRGFREGNVQKYPRFEPEFDGESFSSALAMITVVIECMCFEGAVGWDEVHRLVPERSKLRGVNPPPVILGHDRATLSLYDPLENTEEMLDQFSQRLENWSNKSKYFKEAALPLIVRTIEHSTSEASTAKVIRKQLKYVGPINRSYVSSFERLSHCMEEPILELRTLGEFIASILKEGDGISPTGSGRDTQPGTSTLQKSPLANPSGFTSITNPAAEASGSLEPVETESASTIPTSSAYFNTILNPEPTAQASASPRVGGSSAFEDLLEAAGYGPDSKKKSPSPERKPERSSTIDPEYPGSPSYSPPASPSLSVDTLIKPFFVSSIKAPEPSPDTPSSMLLEQSALYRTKPTSAPPGTPKWKIDLSERKGHSIHILHVGPRELNILARCLTLVHKATEKGEECMRAVIAKKLLATEMEREYKQWEEFYLDLENNVSIEREEAKKKMNEDLGDAKDDHGDDDDDGKGKGHHKGKGKAKDPASYASPPYTETHTDWFGTANPRDYDAQTDDSEWGYRQVEARHPASSADETETEIEGYRGAPRDFGFGSVSSMHESEGSEESTRAVEVRGFEEEIGGGEEDQLMADVREDAGEDAGEGAGGRGGAGADESLEPVEIAEEETEGEEESADEGKGSGGAAGGGNKARKVLKSGRRVIGLYGEEV